MSRDAMAPDGMIRLFLAGDVMLGRGVDQLQARKVDPKLEEDYVRDAREYVKLAEHRNGPIPRPVSPKWVWGEALSLLEQVAPDARIINLETSITTSEDRWPDKGIHYRMHPANVPILTSAGIDVAVLANNHVLDHGCSGLEETLGTLHGVGIATAGAGRDLHEAQRPAVCPVPGGRVLVFAFGTDSSGVPEQWTARGDRSGIDRLPDLSDETAAQIVRRIREHRRPNDVVVASIHWGTNWGYGVPEKHVRFAHLLVDGGVDIVHGHSSHHPRPIERYRDRLILYGCGDFIDDYEGISGYEAYRGDLALLYLVTLEIRGGAVRQLRMAPFQLRKMQLVQAVPDDRRWLAELLDRLSRPFGVGVMLDDDGWLDAVSP